MKPQEVGYPRVCREKQDLGGGGEGRSDLQAAGGLESWTRPVSFPVIANREIFLREEG